MNIDNRWAVARQALIDIAQVASKHDSDGIDISFLNSTHAATKVKSADVVAALFDRVEVPDGMTPTKDKILQLWLAYHQKIKTTANRAELKPVNFIILTDGVAGLCRGCLMRSSFPSDFAPRPYPNYHSCL